MIVLSYSRAHVHFIRQKPCNLKLRHSALEPFDAQYVTCWYVDLPCSLTRNINMLQCYDLLAQNNSYNFAESSGLPLLSCYTVKCFLYKMHSILITPFLCKINFGKKSKIHGSGLRQANIDILTDVELSIVTALFHYFTQGKLYSSTPRR